MDIIDIVGDDEDNTTSKKTSSTEDSAILDKDDIHLIIEKMRVDEIRYSALPMEYPPTFLEGIAMYIILKLGIVMSQHLIM